MKRIDIILKLIVTVSFVCFSFAGADEKGEKVIANLQKKYRSVKDATISFTQEVRFGATGAEQVFRGKFFMKSGNRYRIEMEDHTIVTDGKSVWRHTEYNNQVLIDNYREDPRGFSPENILVNIPAHFLPVILGNEKISDKQTLILKLTPKDGKSSVKWMKVWIDEKESVARKIQIQDLSDNLVVYNIDTVSFNSGISAEMFEFKSPDGANVIDLR